MEFIIQISLTKSNKKPDQLYGSGYFIANKIFTKLRWKLIAYDFCNIFKA